MNAKPTPEDAWMTEAERKAFNRRSSYSYSLAEHEIRTMVRRLLAALSASESEVSALKAEFAKWKDCAEHLSDVANLMGTAREDSSRHNSTLRAEIGELKAELAKARAEAFKQVARQVVSGFPKGHDYGKDKQSHSVNINRWMIHDWCMAKAAEAGQKESE